MSEKNVRITADDLHKILKTVVDGLVGNTIDLKRAKECNNAAGKMLTAGRYQLQAQVEKAKIKGMKIPPMLEI